MAKALVSIIMGSDSDLGTVSQTLAVLKSLKIKFEVRILSAHRTPKELTAYVQGCPKRGIKVFITAAGGAAALAGVVAAHTTLPVVGIPIETKSLKGLDSLLSIVQMPGGIPVAAMAIGEPGAKNAGLFAAEILATSDKKITAGLAVLRRSARAKIKKIKIEI
jgi:phosphoribosylaminoimidazole carboxylase PurE protein